MASLEQNPLCYQGNVGIDKARKALVVFAIECALLTTGDDVYKKVSDMLSSNYGRGVLDCLEYPECLTAVLAKMGAQESKRILGSIKSQLEKHSDIKTVSDFLDQLENQLSCP